MSERVKKAHNRLAMATVDRKEHYRLYKSGKQWVIAGAVAVSFALGMLTVETNNAHADTTTAGDNTSNTTDQAAPGQTVTLKNSAASSSASGATEAGNNSQVASSAASSAASNVSLKTESGWSSNSAAATITSSATPSAAVEPASVSTSQASAGSSESTATTSSAASASTNSVASSAATATSTAAPASTSTTSTTDLTFAVGLKDATAAMVDGQLVVTAKSGALSAEDAAAVAAYAQQNQVSSKIVQIDADGDLSAQFALADGDTATVSGTTLTINLQSGHYLNYKQTNDIEEYANKNGLTVQDNTLGVVYTDTLNRDVDLSNNPHNLSTEDLQTYTEVRSSDPLAIIDNSTVQNDFFNGWTIVQFYTAIKEFNNAAGIWVSHSQRNKAASNDQKIYPDSRFLIALPTDNESWSFSLDGKQIVYGTVSTPLSRSRFGYLLTALESEKIVRAMAYASANNVKVTFSDSGSGSTIGKATDVPLPITDVFIATGIATVIGPDGKATTDSETGQGQIIVADPNNLTDTSSDKPATVNTDVSAVLAQYSDKTKYVITVSSDTTGMLTDPNLTGKATADIGFIDALNGVEPTITYTVKSLATVDNPGTQPGTTAADLTKTVTEVANYGEPVSQSNQQITVNNYYRTATYTTNTDGTVDPDSIVYSAWVLDDPTTAANEGATAVTSTGAAVDGSFAALTDEQLQTPANYTATVATSGDTTTTDNSAADYSFTDNADNSALTVTRDVTYKRVDTIIHFVDEDEGNKELATYVNTSEVYQYRPDQDPRDASGKLVDLSNYKFDQTKFAAEGGTLDTSNGGEDILHPTSGDIYIELQHKTTDSDVTAARTIKYVMSDGSTAPAAVSQTATWNMHTDLVTGESTYTQKTGFDAVTSPDVAGYTPDTKTVAATDVASGTSTTAPTDAADVTVTYSANEQTAEVQYIDDTTGAKLDSDVLNGKTNAAIDFKAVAGKIADFEAKNYELVSDDTKDGATYNATSGDTQTFEVHFKEKVDGPKTPGAGEDGYADTHKDFKVNITATSPDGSDVTPDNGTQTMHFTRTETTNLVTNVVTYGDWTQAPDDAAFITVTPKAVTNYTAKLTNSDGSVDADTQVTDSDFATALTAFAAAKDTATGAYTANFTYTQTNFTPSNPGNDDQTNEDALTKTVTENVTYGNPVSKTTTVTTATFYRTATKDADGNVTYTAWTTDANGDATKGEGSITIAALTTDQKLVPTGYTLGKETQTDASGTTTDGDTDMTVDAGTDDADITVSRTVAYTHTYTPTDTTDPNYDQTHKTLTVKVVDELPGGADDTQDTQSFDFTRTVTDDGAGNLSYGDWTTTGATSYTDVTAAAIDGLTASPDKVTSTTAADEGPVIGDALTAFGAATSDDEPDQTLTVTIKYTAATGSATVTYVDDDKGGATVTSDNVDGALGKTTDYKVVVPDGYELAGGQTYKDGETTPILITADTSDNATIHLVHKIDHNPTNVDSDMLNKTFTITVTAQSPDGSDVTPTGGATTQQIHFTRTASEDEVTGAVTYTAWTETEDPDADYTEVDAKAVADYTTFVNGQAGDKVTEADSATDVASFQADDSNKDGSDTFAITYKQTTFNVEHPGTTDDTQADQLQKVVTETVNYGSPRSGSKVVETVTYYRTATVTYTTDEKGNTTQSPATYSAWSTDKAGTTATSGTDVTGSFDALTDAELDTPTGYTAKVTNADGDDVTADSTADYSFTDDADNGAVNVTLNVDYDKDKGTIYTPGNNPDNLDLTKTVNVTVNYGDPVNESDDSTDGSPAAIKFYRTATTDPTQDKTDEGYYTYGDWTTDPDGDATKGTADVTVDGNSYVDQSKTPSAYAIKTVTTTVDGLTGTKVTADNNSVLVNVTYAKVVNTPNDPGSTPETNKDALTKTVKEVVNYGAPVGGTDTITTVNYYRTVTVGTDANGDPTYTYSAWTMDANVNADTDTATTGAAVNGSFDALTDAQMKTPRGYSAQVTTTGDTTTTDGSAAPYTFADDANNDPVTVTRNVSYTLQPGTTSTPTNNPDNLDLTKTVTVTVNYGDPVNTTDDTQKSINFYRTATTDPTKDPADADYYTYTAWTTDPDGDTTKGTANVTVDGHSYVDGSKTPTNYTETDQTLVDGAAGTTVTADNSTVTVNVSYTKTTDTPKDPGTTPETDRDALTKTVTEVVNYGAPVGGTATITTVNYYRTVTVGADNGGNPTYAYSAWTTDENVNADTDTAPTGAAVNGSFAALTTDQLKTPDGYTATVTTTGATTTTDGSAAPYTFKDNTDNSALAITRNVAYTTTVGPDNPGTEPGTTLDDLTKTVTENVVYGTPVNEQDNAVVSYTFYRTATVDGEGKVVAYGAWTTDQSGTSKDAADQSVTVGALTDLKVPSASYTATVTTDVDGKTTADNTAVTVPGGASTDDQDVTITRTVSYTGHFTPGNPGTDDQTNADALTKKVTETVTYNEPDGTVTTTDGPEQTLYRTANTDADGNVTYGAWTTDPDGDATKGTATVTVAKLADDDVARAGYTYIMKNAVDGVAQADGNVDLTIPGTENGDADVAVTRVVTYAAESQTITVSYIDDTTGKTLEEKSLTGDSATDSGYNVATVVADYEQKGYKVVSNDAPTGNLIFDQDDTQAQTYTVHLTHGTVPGGTDNPTPIKDGGDYTNDFERTITEHVGYVNADGTNAPAAVDQSITFTRTITVDQVTGKVVANGEFTTDWVADGGTDTFAAVTTPDEPGYVADKDSVPAATVTADSKNISVTVTYTPATDTPATISYVDITTGKAVGTDTTVTGTTGQTAEEPITVPDGYKLATTQSAKITDGKTVAITFAADDSDDVTIYLDHQSGPITPTTVDKTPGDPIPGGSGKNYGDYKNDTHKTVTETVHYVGTGDNAAKFPTQADGSTNVEFTRTVTVDYVTGAVVGYGDWDAASKTFPDVTSPVVDGWTPDSAVVSGKTTTATGDDQSVTVTYTQNDVPYTGVPTGPDGQPLPHTTGVPGEGQPGKTITRVDIPGYVPDPGYSDPEIPDGGGDVELHYLPKTQTANVHYIDQDGHELATETFTGDSDSAIDFDTTEYVAKNFAKYSVVTDQTASGADFDHEDDKNQDFNVTLELNDVPYTGIPTGPDGQPLPHTTGVPGEGQPGKTITRVDIPGYVPDPGYSDPEIPDGGGDVELHYLPKTQTANVHYFDQDGNELATETFTGDSDSAIDFDTTEYVAKNFAKYSVVTDQTASGADFDHEDDKNQDFNVTLELNDVPYTGVPTGPDGQPLPHTTGVPGEGQPGKTITRVDIPGYVPDPGYSDPEIPDGGGDVELHYLPKTQTANVHYFDQDGKELATETFTGDSDSAIGFDTTDYVAKNFAKYSVVTDQTASGADFDHDDGTDQSFNVTLTLKDVTYTGVPTGPDGQPLPHTTGVPGEGQPGKTITRVDIPGYVPDPGYSDPEIPDGGGDVVLHYLPKTQTAVIRFVDGNGTVLTARTVTGDSDSALDHGIVDKTVALLVNAGFALNSDGTIGATFDHDDDTDQVFVVTMTKRTLPSTGGDETPSTTPTPAPSTTPTPAQPSNGGTTTPTANTTVSTGNSGSTNTLPSTGAAKRTLPQTGDDNANILSIIGIGMVGMFGLFGLAGKKRKRQ